MSLWADLREDTRRMRSVHARGFPRYVLESLLFDNGYQAVVFYRLARACRWLPGAAGLIRWMARGLTRADLHPDARIGPGLMLSHGMGTVVEAGVRIGPGALLLHGVRVGRDPESTDEALPTLGAGVFVGARAQVLGPVRLGDGVLVGAGAMARQDVAAGEKVLAPEAEIAREAPAPDPG